MVSIPELWFAYFHKIEGTPVIDFGNFYQIISDTHLSHWLETLPEKINIWKKNKLHGKFQYWEKTVLSLPEMTPYKIDLLNNITAKSKKPLNENQRFYIKTLMHRLMPWRKGPFSLYGLNIDAEWRSDWKWKRIFPYLSDLKGRIVLDVGCGNGYYLWRILGAGANLVIGIDPIQLFLCQFEAVRKLLGREQRIHILPISIEQLPKLKAFDTVFSMGVLYHCRSPLEHIWKLKNQLVKSGELVLETLVVNGNETTILVPNDRYACMRNVYFIPSVLAVKRWLSRCGFIDIHVADICPTSTEEQRRTEWMTGKSLSHFLSPDDAKKTIEGYPAPIRACLIAKKP